jgi:crotonobetainyl-CoA:carnitine CoA-transferase CaiB-like acyl-CoA transferase
MNTTTRSGPAVLSALRIIDAGTMIGGPFAGTLAADYGADVIKIEKPGLGDPMREWAPIKEGQSLWWKVTARNKRLITLNLSAPRGRDLFLRLAAEADVVIENFRPGTFARWGLSVEELIAVNPRLVLVHVSGYGQTGPYAHRPGYGTIAEGMTGIPSFTGFPANPPTLPAFPLADTTAATFALIGLLAAVYERDACGTGRGQEVDVSLYEPLFRLAESQVIGYDQLGIVKDRRGNRLAEDSPRNVYASRDGEWITISASSDRTFSRLTEAIGRPELAADPKFCDNARRIANDVALDEIIAEWMAEHDGSVIMERFERFDVVAGRVYTVEDIFRDPHYDARNAVATVRDPDFGEVRMPGIFPKFSSSDLNVRWPGGRLGEHNEAVYGELLGLGKADLDELRTQGVI